MWKKPHLKISSNVEKATFEDLFKRKTIFRTFKESTFEDFFKCGKSHI
jgi:hypothetical protein